MNRPKIIAVTDNKNWCWTNSVNELVPYLYDFDITVLRSDEFMRIDDPDCCDLVWARGYSFTVKKDKPIPPFIFTMTTGNILLSDRINQCESTGKDAVGVIVQNKHAYNELLNAGYPKVHLIPNGVNTNLFRPSASWL
jgi:hypothetical protein